MTDKDRYWQEQIDLYLGSKLTQKAFCEKHALTLSYFKYHYRRLHLKSIGKKSTRKQKKGKIKLTPVQVVSDKLVQTSGSSSSLCSIHLPNGTCITLHDAQLVERYLQRSVGLC